MINSYDSLHMSVVFYTCIEIKYINISEYTHVLTRVARFAIYEKYDK